MIHSEVDINQSNGHSILECLDTVESFVHPSLVPVWESKRFNTNFVNFKNLCEYAVKSNASTLNEAIENIKKHNHTTSLSVCIDEAYIYDNPHIVDFLEDYVIKPVSKDSIEYRLAEEYMGEFFRTNNPDILDEYNEITGLHVGMDILNEFIDPSNGQTLTQKQMLDKYGSVEAYKQQHQLYKDKANGNRSYSNISNFNTADRSKKSIQAVQDKQIQNVQQQIDNKNNRRAAIARTINGQPGNGGTIMSSVANGIMNAGGQNGGPSWIARNFAALKNWMNNTFGTKFNTNIAGYGSYDQWKNMAKSAVGNIAANELSNKNSTTNQYINKGINKAQDWVNKQGGVVKDIGNAAIDMVNGIRNGSPVNAATEITAGQILSEVYRPRRTYRSSYMRMH